jgi:hypothetical protein
MSKEYKTVNGTSYAIGTCDEVIKVLEQCRLNDTRIVLDYGDKATGESWGEHYDITGTISRSTGSIKVALLIYNSRSIGGSAILTDHIIGIKASLGKKELYKIL